LIPCVVQSKERREHGYPVVELVDGLTAIAHCGSYRRRVLSNHTLNLLLKVQRCQDITEMLSVAKLIWELSFID